MAISEKGKKRYELIVKTALDLFLKNGYEKTSLSDIVAISGGSLASIYTFFKNRSSAVFTMSSYRFLPFSEIAILLPTKFLSFYHLLG